MVCVLMFVDSKLPLDYLVVGACSLAPTHCGPSREWSGGQGQVYSRLAFLAIARAVVSGPVVIIHNLYTVLVDNVLPESCVPLFPTSRVPPSAVSIPVARDYCATSMSDGSVPV
jgi:hypothetical protein